MSRSGSQTRLSRHSAESLEDLKAAFVFINNGVDGHFNSPEDLAKALRGCGKNPTQRNIDIYWKSHKSRHREQFFD
jgi:hypothetical protein